MAGFVVEDPLALGGRLRVADGKRDVAPVDATHLRLGRVPRVVGVGEAHPTEPVGIGIEGIEPRDRPIGDPVGVVPVARDRVVLHLRGVGVASARGIDLE